MNAKRYVVSVAVVLLFLSVSGWLLHDILLKELYMANQEYWRPQETIRHLMAFVHLANFIFALIFCFIYIKGLEGESSAAQGLRFGLLAGLLVYVPAGIIGYVFLPYPNELHLAWTVGGTAQVALAGILAGILYKKKGG